MELLGVSVFSPEACGFKMIETLEENYVSEKSYGKLIVAKSEGEGFCGTHVRVRKTCAKERQKHSTVTFTALRLVVFVFWCRF